MNEIKSKVYRGFVSFFENIGLTKLEDKEQNGMRFSLYQAKVGCLFCVGNMYCVVLVPKDNNMIGTHKLLSELRWISFQTRNFDHDIQELKSQSFSKEGLLNKIEVTGRSKTKTTYMCKDLPLKVELLHSGKDPSEMEYSSDTGTLASALETYNCVVSFF